jgi:hypothetical protein
MGAETVRLRPKRAFGLFLAVGMTVIVVSSGSAAAGETSGPQRFDGGLIVSTKAGKRKVLGTVIAGSGVFNGVGRLVERTNHPGEGNNISRDDLVFADGTLHILNRTRHMSFALNRNACTAKFKAQQTTTIDGGTRKFAGATGTFAGTVTGSGTLHRKPDGSCDLRQGPLAEIDVVAATGTLAF